VGQKLAQKLDGLLVADVALVRVVQKAIHLVQNNMKAGAMNGINGSPKMIQQRLNLPPVDVVAKGVLKDCAQQIQMLIAQGDP
jgi:hypothetical protein